MDRVVLDALVERFPPLARIDDFRGSAEGDVIAEGGKTLPGAFDSAAEKSSLHDVSAWSAR